jgi:hypothetical protein
VPRFAPGWLGTGPWPLEASHRACISNDSKLHLPADFPNEGWLALELAGEGLDGAEGRGADMVLHALDVVVDDLIVEAEELEEIGEQLVTLGNVAGEGLASCSEYKAAVFLVLEQTLGIKTLDHVGDAGLGNLEASGDIDDTGVALGVDELQDALQIILDSGGGAKGRGGIFAGHSVEDRARM